MRLLFSCRGNIRSISVSFFDYPLTSVSLFLHSIGDKEAKAEEKKKQDTVNKIMSEMWKYSQTYEYAVVDPSGQTKKESAWCRFCFYLLPRIFYFVLGLIKV